MTERDSDRTWLEALAGREGGTGSDAAEARRLRAGILAREVEEPPAVAAFDRRREDELVERAHREGLIEKRTFASWGGWQGLAALASAASVLLVLGFLLRDRAPAPETVRSGPGGIVRLEAKGAHELQHAIEAELRAAGIAVVVYDRLGSFGLDADLPTPVSDEVRRILDRHRIPVPEDGVLKVELVEP